MALGAVQTGSLVWAIIWAVLGTTLLTAYAADHADFTMPSTALFVALWAESLTDVSFGMATAAKMPITTMTMTNSIRVKPSWRCLERC